MEHDTIDWTLLSRYVAGECSEAEVEIVRAWVGEDPRHESELALLRYAADFAAGLPSAERTDAMWGGVAAELEPPAAAVPPRVAPRLTLVPTPQRRWWAKPLAAAAVLALTVGGALAWRSGMLDLGRSTPRQVAVKEFHTTRGQRATMTLLDGTHVALGPDSRMRAAIGESGPREVVLDGEAVFEVVHDSTRPFVVRVGGTLAEDLGTTFAVRGYAGEPVRVVVAEGIVGLRDTASAPAARKLLEPHDLAVVAEDGTITVERGVDPGPYIAWKNGRLVFRRARFRDVAPQLERWFDVEIVVEDSALLDATINASFGDAGVDQLLHTLGASLDATFERQGRTVRLRERD